MKATEYHDDAYDQYPLPRHVSNSKSPEEIENEKPGRPARATRSNSAKLRKPSSKTTGKDPKNKSSSSGNTNEDHSLHRRNQLDQDIHNSQRHDGPIYERDDFDSLKSAQSHSSRKMLSDNRTFKEHSATNLHHIGDVAESLSTQPTHAS
jgi:hypothetical protein